MVYHRLTQQIRYTPTSWPLPKEKPFYHHGQIDGRWRRASRRVEGRYNATIIRGDCKSGFEITVYGNSNDGHARLPW